MLSSSNNPLQCAESWFAESKWHLQSWKMEPHWPDLIKALCQKEPCSVGKCLKFVPKIQLLPLSLQRNLLAFLVNHAPEISTESLMLLRDCYGNPEDNLSNQWSTLHLKHLQNKICLRKNELVAYKASDLVPIKIKNRIKSICQSLKTDPKEFENTCDKGMTDTNKINQIYVSEITPWINEQPTLQNDLMDLFTEAKILSADAAEPVGNPISISGQQGTAMASASIASTSKIMVIHGTVKPTKTSENMSIETNFFIKNTTSAETANHENTGSILPTVNTGLEIASKTNTGFSDVKQTEELISSSIHLKNKSTRDGTLKRQESEIEHLISPVGGFETECKKLRVEVTDKESNLVDKEEKILSNDLKEKLEKVSHAWMHSQKSSIELGFLGNLDNTQINNACRILKLEELDTKHLTTVSQDIVKMSDTLPITTVAALAKHLFMKKILDLLHPPSRQLMNAMVVFSKAYPMTIVQCILIPVIQSDKFATPQCSLVTTLINEALNVDNKHEFLRNIFKECILWNVHITMCVQFLIDSKLQLDCGDFTMITSGFQHQACHLCSCPKFAKLLHSFVKKYGSQLNSDHVTSLRKVLDLNKTFLKKAVLSAIDKIAT